MKRKLLYSVMGLIIALLIFWAFKILYEQNNWQVISGLTTLFLALAAFWTIRQNYSFRRQEKKERLLNEIIEWAIDVAKPKYDLNLVALTSSTKSIDDLRSAQLLSWASSTDTLIVRGEYISKITLIFTQDLKIVVEKARRELEKHASFLNDLIHAKGSPTEIGKHNYELTQSAKKVIEEATNIKTKDIS